MSTAAPTVDLTGAASDAALQAGLDEAATAHLPVTVRARLADWDRIVRWLLDLRASGRVAQLLLDADGIDRASPALAAQLQFLRSWDQCWLANVLVFLGADVPEAKKLESEAKLELMFAKEWLAAIADPAFDKYPPLPWRRFVRTTNEENGTFAEKFLAAPDEAARLAATNELLAAKRKVVNRFPKSWGSKKRSTVTNEESELGR